MDGRKRLEDATCGQVFFENGEKSPFSKILIRVDRAFRSVHMYPDIFENGAFSEKYASTRSVFVSLNMIK